MSVETVQAEKRPCLHCLFVDLIDQFFADPNATSDESTIDTDEVIEAIAKTVAELTCGQDGAERQKIIEQLMQEIMRYDGEFRHENEAGSPARH